MEKSYKEIEPERPNVENEEKILVKNEIGMARQMCAQMGNNDEEFDLLNNIWKEYEEGHLTAEQAIKNARAIPENKVQR